MIEDAAQAHGARWRGRRAGRFGLAAAFSFYPSKNLGAFGDGGTICTERPGRRGAARRLRNLGQLGQGRPRVAGFNERLDTIQAAVLGVKLGRLDAWNASRRDAAAHLSLISSRPARRAAQRAPGRGRPPPVPGPRARDRVRAELGRAGIGTGIHYSPAVHRAPARSPRALIRRASVEERRALGGGGALAADVRGITEAEVLEVCARLEPSLAALSATTALARGAT